MRTVVFVDSSKIIPFRRVNKTIFECIQHFGIWYESIDLNWSGVSLDELEDVSLIILGQEGIIYSFSDTDLTAILKMVDNGCGLVIFDGYINKYPEKFLKTAGIENFSSGKTSLLSFDNHWITETSAVKDILLKNPAFHYYSLKDDNKWSVFMRNEDGYGCGFARSFGRGKIVFFSTLPSIFLDEYTGHTEGLDGVFFRSLVWAAKKPFITKTMPPFVTVRVDDVSASGSPVCKYPETVRDLKYVDVLNKYHFIPNLGLFIDDLKQNDEKKIREKFYDGLAEFSPHAFSDPENVNANPIYMKHNGEEFSEEELENNFKEVDVKFSRMGVKMSATLNAHFGEIGLKSLPFLRERGVKYFMNPVKIGKRWDEPGSKNWEIKPYNKPYFSLGYIPEDSFFFNVISCPPRIDYSVPFLDSSKPDFDFLFGCTTFWNENKKVDVEKAIERGIFQIKRGLENGFFGCLTTHEQRISHIALAEFEKIISGISRRLNMPVLFKNYDFISQYAENRANFKIERIDIKEKISVLLKGKSRCEQLLYVFTDYNGSIKSSFLKVPTFEKQVLLSFSI